MIYVLPPSSPYVAESRESHIPTHIHLPDGRQVAVTEIINQTTNFQTIVRRYTKIKTFKINDRTSSRRGAPRHRPPKYTPEERQIIAHSSIPSVSERYNINPQQAYYLINNSRMILGLSKQRRREMKL
jgi:hypothetical protein